ncbi:MAG: efflux RND transporter periplasmic adaptor subunit [Myxococcota bacterium]|nr:efflux RND transporter periplasmic adaptor subunit [Myxococcota bacterium]
MDRPIARPRGITLKRSILAVLGVVLMAVSALAYPSVSRWAQSERSVNLTRLRIGAVVRGDLVRDIAVQGKVVAAFHPTLFSPSPGIVMLDSRTGDAIAQGQILGRVESPELENQLEQEQASLMSLESGLGRQRIELEQISNKNKRDVDLLELELAAAERAQVRAEKSRTLGILTEVAFEAAKDTVAQLSLRLAFARENAALQEKSLRYEIKERHATIERQRLVLENLKRRVAALSIRSPVAGFVSRVHVQDRASVEQNAKLFTVVDMSAFEVEIEVPESYADEVGVGTAAVMQLGSESLTGRVKTISPEVSGHRVWGTVSFDDQSPKGLIQNQRIATRLILASIQDVLKVPRGPFLETGGGREAYVVKENMAVLRNIRVGARSISEVEIVTGLEVGGEIVLSDTKIFKGAKRALLHE